MRRVSGASIGVVVLILASLGTASMALAAGGPKPIEFKGYKPDNGTCGNSWADDTYKLRITVLDNGNGTFNVHTQFLDGKFVTRAGDSPGACTTINDPNNHTPIGTSLIAGIKGTFKATVDEVITAASYDPSACGPRYSLCHTRYEFILAAFGCDEDTACANFLGWDYEYLSKDSRLIYRKWLDAWPLIYQEFAGDIASS